MKKSDVSTLYRDLPYLEAYRHHTDLRVENDPQEAVGGRWDEIGHLQFSYLVSNGLGPSQRMLDIGCGTLRGGRHFIRYLDRDCYTGVDISSAAIAAARTLVAAENLVEKSPVLLHNPDPARWFGTPDDATYEVLLAQSVFTHLDVPHIEACFHRLGSIMTAGARFFFTFNESQASRRRDLKDFVHPFGLFSALSEQHGFDIEKRTDYAHPRGQVMAVLTRPS
jgi:predicted TPR repeat methyltransferase